MQPAETRCIESLQGPNGCNDLFLKYKIHGKDEQYPANRVIPAECLRPEDKNCVKRFHGVDVSF